MKFFNQLFVFVNLNYQLTVIDVICYFCDSDETIKVNITPVFLYLQ